MFETCDFDDFVSGRNPKTLGDWVKNFRVKKMQMKRKLKTGGHLRVCAMLAQALTTAEHELRRKQQERFNRWLELQEKLNSKSSSLATDYTIIKDVPSMRYYNEVNYNCNVNSGCYYDRINDYNSCMNNNGHAIVDYNKRDEEISNIWKDELNDLDQFMRNMSGRSRNDSSTNSNNDVHNCSRILPSIEVGC